MGQKYSKINVWKRSSTYTPVLQFTSTDNSHVILLTFSRLSLLCGPLANWSILEGACIVYPVLPPSSLGANQKQVATTVILVAQPINQGIQTAVDKNQ